MENQYLDNRSNGKVGDVLKNNISKGSFLSIISHSFTIYAYKYLREQLNKTEKLRLLFGDIKLFSKDLNVEKREFFIAGNKYELKLKNELKQSEISRECAKWIKDKVEIKVFSGNEPLDFKFYHIKNSEKELAIVGNADFTSAGLGFENSPKIFTNELLTDKEKINHRLAQFEELWNDKKSSTDKKEEILEMLQSLYKENSPEFIYYVTLYNLFKNYLNEVEEDKLLKKGESLKKTEIWNKLYKFQKDGVLGAIERLGKYNGCIIADSVGLGKTFTALAIIKYYELTLPTPRVLVIAPKKLRDNWVVYKNNSKNNIFINDCFRYDVLNHTDLSRKSGISGDINLKDLNWGNYDLVVIDESHVYRNGAESSRYAKLMEEVIKGGTADTKVLMLSATPVNNRFNDLKYQVLLIAKDEDNAFEEHGIKSLEHIMKIAQTQFNNWLKIGEEHRTVEKLLESLNSDYFKTLDMLSIARSRKHIEKYYDISEIGKFPERLKPKTEKEKIDTADKFPSLRNVNARLKKLMLAVYSPTEYILPHLKETYEEKLLTKINESKSFKQLDRERALVSLMRVNILKRLESSVYSFNLTLSKIIAKIEINLKKIETIDELQQKKYSENLDEFDDIDDDGEDFTIGKLEIPLKDMDLKKWRTDLLQDLDDLKYLANESKEISVERDKKLKKLKEIIKEKIHNPLNPGNKKILIFTAFSDTAKYLYENLADWIKQEENLYSALVTGSYTKTNFDYYTNDFSDILINFSPRSKERNKFYSETSEEIDLLIGTDCISEGQNLQDCDFLINYDIHWNPVRIIQRFGRIDRLGSINDKIQLVNFWPDIELDEYINLESRVKGRMNITDISATGDDNVLNEKEQKELEYRKNQLKQLQEQVVDLEDMKGGVSITDLNFNDFKMDLYDYAKNKLSELENAPLGMYAITKNTFPENNKGVIFCLKKINEQKNPDGNNPLDPYFLIYVLDNGEIKYKFVESKKTMDIFRALSHGKSELENELISEFETETSYANNMETYSELLKKAVESIIGENEKKGMESIFSSAGTNLFGESFRGVEDFELISFLIIK